MSKTLSEEIHSALCCISECCVDESKRNITSREAVEKIREYLSVTNDDRYSKNFNISLKREILQKDQRISELEKENQTAVKEFADELIKIMKESGNDFCEIRDFDGIKYSWFNYVVFEDGINNLLKERGVE